MSDALLEATRVTLLYGQGRGIQDASLTMGSGATVALVGQNGAGKTTFIRALTGEARPQSGNIKISSFTLGQEDRAAKQLLGFVPDGVDVFEKLTLAEYIDFTGVMYGLDRNLVTSREEKLLNVLGLSDVKNSFLGTLSHGMRKKAQIAAALVHRPPLIIMDEPTNGLDPAAVVLLQDMFIMLKQSGHGILVATHNLAFAESVCDEIFLVHASKVVESGSPRALREKYQCPSLGEVFIKATSGGMWRESLAEVFSGI